MNYLPRKLQFTFARHSPVLALAASTFWTSVLKLHPVLGVLNPGPGELQGMLSPNVRHYRSMPTHGIGRYKYLLPRVVHKKKKEKMKMKPIKVGTEVEYGDLNVNVFGYDMTLVEHYSQYVHNLCNRFKIQVAESYALPTKTTEIVVMQEKSTKMHVDAVLKTHKRVIQLSGLNATICPIFIEVLLQNQPEGVELSIKEHTEIDFLSRFKARPELEELKSKMS